MKFNKSQKLCGSLRVKEVMTEGEGLVTYPMRWKWQWAARKEGVPQMQLMVWAPKKNFHHAVDRNRMRRLMREAYRLNQTKFQPVLEQHPDEMLLMGWNYLDTKLCDLCVIEKAIIHGIAKLH